MSFIDSWSIWDRTSMVLPDQFSSSKTVTTHFDVLWCAFSLKQMADNSHWMLTSSKRFFTILTTFWLKYIGIRVNSSYFKVNVESCLSSFTLLNRTCMNASLWWYVTNVFPFQIGFVHFSIRFCKACSGLHVLLLYILSRMVHLCVSLLTASGMFSLMLPFFSFTRDFVVSTSSLEKSRILFCFTMSAKCLFGFSPEMVVVRWGGVWRRRRCRLW